MYELRITESTNADISFYGSAKEFIACHDPEVILHGPAETGKTIAALHKLHACAIKYPNASLVIARKFLSSTYATVLQTFINKVLPKDEGLWPCFRYGKEKPEFFQYYNGSRIWVTGLDKSSKVLSSEHDIIYVNQCEDLTSENWQTLTTRTTGRAGNMPYSQTIGDANPSYPSHWMYHRDSITMLYSKHEENPALFNQETGKITEQGMRTMAVLNRLTGVLRDRLLDGKPAQAEGVIYSEYNPAHHLISDSDLPELRRYIAGVDWGYRNPGVMAIFGLDGDDNLYLVAQYYRTNQTDDWWLDRAKEVNQEFKPEKFVCDPSQPSYIEKWRREGLNAMGGKNDVLPGITKVKQALSDNQLFIVDGSIRQPDERLRKLHAPYHIQDEFAMYVWKESTKREQPIKENDHGMDAIRYVVMELDTSYNVIVEDDPIEIDLSVYKTRGRSEWRKKRMMR